MSDKKVQMYFALACEDRKFIREVSKADPKDQIFKMMPVEFRPVVTAMYYGWLLHQYGAEYCQALEGR